MNPSERASQDETASRSHRQPQHRKDSFLAVRQWLNIIFMLGAAVGLGIYFLADQHSGTVVILGAMLFKIVECTLRFFR